MKRKNKKISLKFSKVSKGITLISLVVTIIVLIILAGVSLNLILGENGLIGKAKDAASRYEREEANELSALDGLANELYFGGSDEEKVIQEELTQANTNFTYEPEEWNNDKIVVTVSTTIEIQSGYIMQVSKDGVNYTDGNSLTFEENGTMYVRLWNGKEEIGSAIAQVEKIDKTAPEITFLDSNIGSITINATDEASGIVGYVVKEDNNTPDINEFTTFESSLSINELVVLKQGTTYNVWVMDEAGNISECKTVTTRIQLPNQVKVIDINYQEITQITIGVGEEVELRAEVLPNDSYYQNVVWTTDDESIVSLITSYGKIKGVKAGNTKIKVEVSDTSVYQEVEVTVCEHQYMYNYDDYNHYCSLCNKQDNHNYNSNGHCSDCGYDCGHMSYMDGVCNNCGYKCEHSSGFSDGFCYTCGYMCDHHMYDQLGNNSSMLGYYDRNEHTCSICFARTPHDWEMEGNTYKCSSCGYQCNNHSFETVSDPYYYPQCFYCPYTCVHEWNQQEICSICGAYHTHSGDMNCDICYKELKKQCETCWGIGTLEDGSPCTCEGGYVRVY